MSSDRQALEQIAALAYLAGTNELATRMAEIAEAALAAPEPPDRLSAIQAAAEPVREIADLLFANRSIYVLLDAIGKPDKATGEAGGKQDA